MSKQIVKNIYEDQKDNNTALTSESNSKLSYGNLKSFINNISSQMAENGISNKDIIFSEVMAFDRASQDPKSNYELKELWLDLIVNNNIINFEVFIKKAINFFNISSLSELNSITSSFNDDFTYFKILDRNKVYLNSESIVTRIELSLSNKKEKKFLYDRFLKDLSLMKLCDWSAYEKQKEEIIVYLSGGTKYSKSFLESVKKAIGVDKFSEIIPHLKSVGFFSENFEPLYESLKLDSSYSYNEKDIDSIEPNKPSTLGIK